MTEATGMMTKKIRESSDIPEARREELLRILGELRETIIGSKVDKIHQPARDQIILSLRGPGGAGRLLQIGRAHV